MEAHRIKLTSSAMAHGRVSLRPCDIDFFPKDSFGKPTRREGTGKPLRLHIAGLDKPIDTDLPTDRDGRPRWFFRDRAWVRHFITAHNLSAGDNIVIKRLNKTEYQISPVFGQIHNLFPQSA